MGDGVRVSRYTRAPMETFRHRHLLGIDGLDRSDVLQILARAEAAFTLSREPIKKNVALRGKSVINLFFEASTRTRTSFELAGKRLSADVVNISTSTSSVTKGETLIDTARTIEAMRPDAIVVRHPSSGAAALVADRVGCHVINAGDGAHEHPTQALLDAFTIRRAKKTLEGLEVAICGDVLHSRVARSNARLLRLFGSKVRFVGPRTLMPPEGAIVGVAHYDSLARGLDGVDVVMVLRIQRERLEGALLPSLREFSRTFGIGPRTIGYAKPDAIVMHPGPMNRGVEIDPSLADGPRSAVLDQVEAGVAVRMAVLELLVGAAA